MKPDLTQIIQCPISGQCLRRLTSEEIECINQQILAGKICRYDASIVYDILVEGYVTEDDKYAYTTDACILMLLTEQAIVLHRKEDKTSVLENESVSSLGKQKQYVQDFYNKVGWQKKEGSYTDSLIFIDDRDVSRAYQGKCMQRIQQSLPPRGNLLLDVASGPLPDGKETYYAQGFTTHICVDISITALMEAKQNLGDKGIYILGDITNLPIQADVMDAATSLCTIFHVPKNEQRKAFLELHRVLKPGATAVVLYSWNIPTVLSYILTLPVVVYWFITEWIIPWLLKGGEPTLFNLYYYAYSYRWFNKQEWPFEYKISVLSSLNSLFLKTYVHRWLAGERILDLVYRLEEQFPSPASRFGCYPLIIIRKSEKMSNDSG